MEAQQQKYAQKNRKSESKRGRFKRARLWIKLLLIIVLSIAALVSLACSPLFNISTIEIEGNSYYSENTIKDLLQLSVGKNAFKYMAEDFQGIFELRYRKEEERIEKACAYIKRVETRLVLPARILVQVSERTAIGILPYLGTSLLIDGEGYILEAVKDKEYNLPVIRGVEFDHYELGRKAVAKKPQGLDKAIKLINLINKEDNNSEFDIYPLIDWIDISDEENICMLVDSRLVIKLGNLEDVRYRISVLKYIYLKNIKSTDKGLVDFTLSENPVFIPEK